MALEGKIVDFGVADILQLISQQQKTGVLIVERSDQSIEVLFWNGMIISAHPIAKAEKELLGEKLVKSELITPEQLERALDHQDNNFQHLGEILVEMGILGKDQLDRIIGNQIYDTFAELFQWKEGSYAFEAKMVNFNEKVFTPLALEHIILDVLRMMDELPDIMKSIGSIDTLFKKTGRAVSVNDEDDNGKMSPEEATVFNLLDGHTSVQDLVDKSLLGRYTAAKTLKILLDNDYVEIVHYDVQEVLKNKVVHYLLGKQVLTIAAYSLLAFLVVGLTTVSPPYMTSTFGLFEDRFNLPITLYAHGDHSRTEKVKNALQIYFWENGKYPDELEDLVITNILRRQEIANGNGGLYKYRSQGLSYSLN